MKKIEKEVKKQWHRLFFLVLLLSFALSFSCFVKASDEIEEFEKKTRKQSIILDKKQLSLINYLTEKQIIDLVTKSIEMTTTWNVLNEDTSYDPDQLSYIQKQTGVRLGFLDKRCGRVVVTIEKDKKYYELFGSGSFIDKKIFTNAHVLERLPLSSQAVFEQGLSLHLRNNINIDDIVNLINQHKRSLLSIDLYEKEREKINSVFEEGLYSLYQFEKANILKEYVKNKINSDIAYIQDYSIPEFYKDFSHQSYSFPVSYLPLKNPNQAQSIYKINHYPLGIPLQRTSYGMIDYETTTHVMHTLGGSSGGIITDYNDNILGLHSGSSYGFHKGDFGFSERNEFQNLSYLNEFSDYFLLSRNKRDRIFSKMQTNKYQIFRKMTPLLSVFLKKKNVKIF